MGKQAQHVLNVRVLGMDANGRPIRQDAWTVTVSRTALVIGGLGVSVNAGEVLSLQFKDRKVRYRVLWAGEPETSKAGQLGLEQVHPEDDLFQMPYPQETMEDAPAEVPADGQQPRGDERRTERRFEASLPVEVKSTQGTSLRAEISDISLSGCYVNTLFPVAVGSIVNVMFWVGDEKLSVKGKVRTCVRGVGCGIEFLDVPEQAKKLLSDYFASGCRPASDRREDRHSPVTEAEITLAPGPSQKT